MSKTRLRDHLLAFTTIFIWGLTFLSTKSLGSHLSSLEILFGRYLIAYAVLWVMCPKPFFFQGWKKEDLLFVTALSGTAVYQYLENLSVSYTSPASVSFITATAPIFTALLAHRFLGEKVTAKTIIGMLVSLLGVFFICFGDSKNAETGMIGDLIILGSIWLWAVYSVLVKKIAEFGFHQLQQTRRLFLYSLVCMLPFMLFQKNSGLLSAFFLKESLFHLVFLGVFASALCFAGWNHAVEKLGATTTSKYLFIMPLITLIGQALYNQNALGKEALLGMAVTLLGIGISEFSLRRKEIQKKTKEL